MRALRVDRPGVVALSDVDDAVARDGEIVIAPLLAGVCGTDLELIDGTIDPAYVRYPLVLGHEFVGRLLDDVAGVGGAGDRVVVEGLIPCGRCGECQAGDSNRCEVYDEIGFTRPGALAERIAVPSQLVHRLAGSVDPADAALVEPMAVVWRALTRIPFRDGARVCVVGDGTVALLAAHLVGLFHPSRLVVVGRRSAQEVLALRAGADAFVTDAPTERFDLVIEAAGNVAAVETALALAERGAMVILLGLPPHGNGIELAPDDLVNGDLVVQGSFSYTRRAFAEVVARVNAGELRPSFLITHRFELADAMSAISALRGDGVAPDEPRGKVMLAVADEVTRRAL